MFITAGQRPSGMGAVHVYVGLQANVSIKNSTLSGRYSLFVAGEDKSDESLSSGGTHRSRQVDRRIPSPLRRARQPLQVAGA